MVQPLYGAPRGRLTTLNNLNSLGGRRIAETGEGSVLWPPPNNTAAGPGVVANLREALSGAARRPVMPTPFQVQMMESGVPVNDAYYQSQNPPQPGVGVLAEPGMSQPPFPAGASRSTSPSPLTAAALGPSVSPEFAPGQASQYAREQPIYGSPPVMAPTGNGTARIDDTITSREPYSPMNYRSNPWRQGPGAADNTTRSPYRQSWQSNRPGLGDYSGRTGTVVPQTRGPMTPGTTYQRPPRPDEMPGDAGGSVPAATPRTASPVMAALRPYTPEGELADSVARLRQEPLAPYIAQGRAEAQALGQQRYAQSSEGQAMIGRTQQAQERYSPAGRPDYESMTPVQAAMVSQNTYRSGGRAGAMGGMSTMDGSLRDREDAIALAQQAAGPPRPSNGAQIRESRGMMQQAVSGELERMGGRYNPELSFENNARGMSPGTTFTGETSTGVPVIVSRGSAAPISPERQAARDIENRGVRMERAGRMAELGQRRMAQLQQERDYAMDPVNRLAMAAMGDPRAAAALGGGIVNSRVGMGQNAATERAMTRQMELDAAAQDRASQELQARLGVSKAEADLAIGKLKALDGMDNPQARAQAAMEAPGFADYPIALRNRIAEIAWPGGQGAAATGASNAPTSVTEAVAIRSETAPVVESLIGAGASGWKPDAIASSIMERLDDGAPFADQDLQSIQQDYQARAVSEKDFKPREKAVTNALTASGEEKVVFEQMLDARLRQAMPITVGEVQAIREQARIAAEVARQSTQKTVESPAVYTPSGISDTGRYLGMP